MGNQVGAPSSSIRDECPFQGPGSQARKPPKRAGRHETTRPRLAIGRPVAARPQKARGGATAPRQRLFLASPCTHLGHAVDVGDRIIGVAVWPFGSGPVSERRQTRARERRSRREPQVVESPDLAASVFSSFRLGPRCGWAGREPSQERCMPFQERLCLPCLPFLPSCVPCADRAYRLR